MFCRNCGCQFDDSGSFCPKCGTSVPGAGAQPASPPQSPSYQQTPYQQAPYQQAGYAVPRSGGNPIASILKSIEKKTLIMIGAGVLALAFVVTAIATSGFGLLERRAQNPIALIYDGTNGLLELDSYSFDASASIYGESVRCEGYVIYGKSLEDMVFYAEASSAYGDSAVVAMYEGNVYFGEDRYVYSINISDALDDLSDELQYEIDRIDNYSWLSDSERRDMKNYYRELQDMLTTDYINNYFKSGGINRDKLIDTLFTEILSPDSFSAVSAEEAADYFTTKAMQQSFDLFEAFIHKGLEDDEVLENALSYHDEKKSGGTTTHTISIDPYGMTEEFFNYVLDNIDKYRDLNSALDDAINSRDYKDMIADELGIRNVTVSAVITSVRDLVLGELSYAYYGDFDDVRITVAVNSKGDLEELGISYDRMSATIEISDHNSAKADTSRLRELADDAEDYN